MRKPSEATIEEARAEAEALRDEFDETDRLDAPLFRGQSMRGIGERHRDFMKRHPWYLDFMEEEAIGLFELLDQLSEPEEE